MQKKREGRGKGIAQVQCICLTIAVLPSVQLARRTSRLTLPSSLGHQSHVTSHGKIRIMHEVRTFQRAVSAPSASRLTISSRLTGPVAHTPTTRTRTGLRTPCTSPHPHKFRSARARILSSVLHWRQVFAPSRCRARRARRLESFPSPSTTPPHISTTSLTPPQHRALRLSEHACPILLISFSNVHRGATGRCPPTRGRGHGGRR